MHTFKRITPAAAYARWQNGELRVVDIRDLAAVQAGHIRNSYHLTDASLGKLLAETPLEQPLLVVCYHGNSSQRIAAYLAEQGFCEVLSLDGGFSGWQLAYPETVVQG